MKISSISLKYETNISIKISQAQNAESQNFLDPVSAKPES